MFAKKCIPFFIALSLLTTLPVAKCLPDCWSAKNQKLSVIYYPLIGLLLALILYGLHSLLSAGVSSLVGATFVVVFSIALTGAIHLDGLADATDAAYATHSLSRKDNNKYKEKVLSVFKDPRAGPMAVIVLIVVVLSKVILLSELMGDLLVVLLLMMILPRLLASWYVVITPYAKVNGLGMNLAKSVSIWVMLLIWLATTLFFLIFLPFGWILLLFGVGGGVLLLWRNFWLKRINGFVGDCVGALIEINEVLVLCLLYLLKNS